MAVRDRFTHLLGHSAVRQRIVGPVAFDGLILTTNLITGIVIARSLGPAGRGELAAILILMQTASWIFSMGAAEAVAYHQARNPAHGGRLIAGWIVIMAPLTVLAIAVGELLLPTLFGAQSAEAVDLGRLYLLLVGVPLLGIVFNAILLGDGRFTAYNSVRLLIPAQIAVGYLVLWPLGGLTVESALIVNATATVTSTIVAAIACISRHGLDRPHPGLLNTTFTYGVKAHGGSLAGFVNARLDLLIIPAFLAAASVGLYSVATNVSSIIGTLTGTVAAIVLPVAARENGGSSRVVIRTMHAVLLIGGTLGLILILLAEPALTLVYGEEFADAAPALRILLPGEVLGACAAVITSGHLAANRPFLSSVPYFLGAALTVGGLVIFLPDGDITTAATITTAAYTVVFVVSVVIYRRKTGLRWRQFLRAPPP
jgi:O-antigen/teichoic acid export membrane protein